MEKKGSVTGSEKRIARGRGKDTLFRVTARNQIELIAIADNKANIVIGINVLLITVIIALLGADVQVGIDRFARRFDLLIPLGVLLFTCLISAVFAIMAAKPQIIEPDSEQRSSKLFFHNFYNQSLDDYIENIFDIMSDKEATYRHMIIDMYNNGLVLQAKYNLIGKSYTVLMVGLVLSVVSYVILAIAT